MKTLEKFPVRSRAVRLVAMARPNDTVTRGEPVAAPNLFRELCSLE
jgi:hypothetical protein